MSCSSRTQQRASSRDSPTMPVAPAEGWQCSAGSWCLILLASLHKAAAAGMCCAQSRHSISNPATDSIHMQKQGARMLAHTRFHTSLAQPMAASCSTLKSHCTWQQADGIFAKACQSSVSASMLAHFAWPITHGAWRQIMMFCWPCNLHN